MDRGRVEAAVTSAAQARQEPELVRRGSRDQQRGAVACGWGWSCDRGSDAAGRSLGLAGTIGRWRQLRKHRGRAERRRALSWEKSFAWFGSGPVGGRVEGVCYRHRRVLEIVLNDVRFDVNIDRCVSHSIVCDAAVMAKPLAASTAPSLSHRRKSPSCSHRAGLHCRRPMLAESSLAATR